MKGEQTGSFEAEALLRLQDRAFVRQAYAALLGRQPDHDGLAYYTERIRQGVRKERVLHELASSPEARIPSETLFAVEAILRAERERERPGLLPRVFRRLLSHALEPMMAKLRIVENLAWRVLHERSDTSQLPLMARAIDDVVSRLQAGGTSVRTPVSDVRIHETSRLAEMKRALDGS